MIRPFTSILKILLLAIPFLASGQDVHECGTPHLSEEQMAAYLSDLEISKNIVHLRESGSISKIPVHFTVLRDQNGIQAAHDQKNFVDQPMINQALQYINEIFEPAGFVFVQIGNLRFIDHDEILKLQDPIRNYSYLSTALNIVIGGTNTGGTVGSANMPTGIPASRNYSNTLWLKSGKELMNATFAHELGHSFGLFHTFEGARLYDNPKDPLQNVPSGVKRHQDNPERASNNFFKRELVIREDHPVGSKLFPFSNADVGGDFVNDTPASCATIAKQDFPDWSDPKCRSYKTMGDCYSGCLYDPEECIYIGNYVDYNGDTLEQTKVMIDNFMSYTGKCRQSFTPGQYDRMLFYQKYYRGRQYDMDARMNWANQVDIGETNQGLKNVVIQTKHPDSDGKHARSISDASGDFESILYQSEVVIEKIEKLSDQPDGTFQKENWLSGIDISDIIAILYHINDIKTLNGHQQLAADLNRDGQITLEDANIIRDLIMGRIEAFGQYNSPWQFIAEQTILNDVDGFHENPFRVTKGDSQNKVSALLMPGDHIVISDGTGPYSGFDAIKIGDVDGSFTDPKRTNVHSRLKESAHQEVAIAQLFQQYTLEEISLNISQSGGDISTLMTPLTSYPNPTLGDFTVAYQAMDDSQVNIYIQDAFGKVLTQSQVPVSQGLNQIPFDGQALAAVLVSIKIIDSEKTHSATIMKISN